MIADADWSRGRAFFGAAAYLALALVLPRTWSRATVAGVLAAALTAWNLTTLVQPLGDHVSNLALAQSGGAWMANPTSAAVNRGVFLCFGLGAVDYIAPAAGGMAWWAVLVLAMRSLATDDTPSPRLARLLPLLGGMQLVFYRGFIELTQAGMPFAVLALFGLRAYDLDAGRRGRALVHGALWLGVAVSFHGAFFAFLPAFLAVVGWHHWRQPRRLAQHIVLTGVPLAVVVSGLLASLWALGVGLEAGHLSGGGDGALMVPLDGAGFRYALFSVAHLGEVANILLVAAPLLALAPLVMVAPASRKALSVWLGANRWLLMASLGCLGFSGLLGFDLGHPADLDLMLCTGAPFLVRAAGVVSAGLGGPTAVRVAAVVATVAVIAGSAAYRQNLVVSPWDPERHPLGPAGLGSYRDAEGDPRPLLRVMGETMAADLRGRSHVLVSLSSPDGSTRPFRCAVIAALGIDRAPVMPFTADGLTTAFPLPGRSPTSILVMTSLELDLGKALLPSRRGPLVAPVPIPPEVSHVALQAIVETGAGLVTTNAVTVRVR